MEPYNVATLATVLEVYPIASGAMVTRKQHALFNALGVWPGSSLHANRVLLNYIRHYTPGQAPSRRIVLPSVPGPQ